MIIIVLLYDENVQICDCISCLTRLYVNSVPVFMCIVNAPWDENTAPTVGRHADR
jgi:hypothetical protein